VIANAESEILVGANGLTTGSGIVEALVRAKQRGVDVRLIADKTTPCERATGIEPLAAARVPIWIDAEARIAHAKTMVIDGAVMLTGSTNWTLGAATNSEALNLVSSPASRQPTRPIGANVSLSPSGTSGARIGAGLVGRGALIATIRRCLTRDYGAFFGAKPTPSITC
jgi:hypothetical protein